MGTTHGHYVAGDYIRVCDLCPVRRNISAMRRTADGSLICDYHSEYQTAFELDQQRGSVRIPRERAVPFPKPQDPYNPYTFIEEEGHLLSFVGDMVGYGARYLDVTSGVGAPVTTIPQRIATLGWVAYYLNGLIVEGKRPLAMLRRAESLLESIATSLMLRQVGFGLLPTETRATSPFYGAIVDAGTSEIAEFTYTASTIVTEEVVMGGLALLNAYRLTGSVAFLRGARAAASYLRNVQAIGRYAVNHTSTDAAGTGYLYTGSLCSEVSVASGFTSNHLFYPAALLALVFWRDLTAVDGDQQIGATAAIGGSFSAIPQQLMSACISDLRECWETGIADSGASLINGLSVVTPQEMFNAFPATKANFPLVTGTGNWEYADGDADDGTQITGANFAKALHALYATEGPSTQVTAVDEWIRSFASNPAFETPDGTSGIVLARSFTGDYDATKGIATLLTVRDADNAYATTAVNGSDLYDWGAFGLLSELWSARHNVTFAAGRRLEVYVNQRWRDGQATDGEHYDELYLLGRSGMSKQTNFTDFIGTTPTIDLGCDDSTPPSSPFNDGSLILWLRADAGISTTGGNVTRWEDQSGYGQHMDVSPMPPTYVASGLNGLPAVRFSLTTYIEKATALLNRNGVGFDGARSRTIFVVTTPNAGAAWGGFGTRIGGPLLSFKTSSPVGTYAMYFVRFTNYGPYSGALINHDWWPEWSAPMFSAVGGSVNGQASYASTPVIVSDRYNGAGGLLRRYVNAEPILQSTDNVTFEYSLPVGVGDTGLPGPFTVGNIGGATSYAVGFLGDISEILIYDGELSDANAEASTCYLAGRYNGTETTSGMVKDAVRASQVGLGFRYNPIANRYPGT